MPSSKRLTNNLLDARACVASAKLYAAVAINVLALVCFAPHAVAQVADPGFAPVPSIAGESLDELIAAGDFRDALNALTAAREPYDLQTTLARAELLLMAGYNRQAEVAFRRVRSLTPIDEPLADYGSALCELMRRDYPNAANHLQRCTGSAEYATHREEIDLALASLSMAKAGSTSTLPRSISQSTSPALLLTQELQMLTQPIASNSPWDLPGGVPRVDEPFGLSAVALVAKAARIGRDGLPILAAPLARGDAAAQIASALLPGEFPAQGSPVAQAVSGWITLSPPAGSRLASGSLASFSIDGSLVAVIDSQTLEYRWDTTQYDNGRHSVAISVTSENGPSTEQPYTRYYQVRNAVRAVKAANPEAGDDDPKRPFSLSDANSQAISDAWSILALQPDYALGEEALASSARNAGDMSAALFHRATAQAISFHGDTDIMNQISAAYAHRIPVVYPNTDKSRLKSHSTTTGLWRGNPAIREVALTFDDGPSPTATPPLLDALLAAKTPGTFFVVGARAQLAPDLIRRMHAEGHEVEDHSYSHPNLDEATPQHVYEEILRNAVIVQALTGIWPHFLRPPGGQSNPRVLQDAAKCGLAGAFWTIDALSAEDTGSPGAVTQFVLKRVKPGAVILMHNGPIATTNAILQLASELRARGYKLVTLLQLARDATTH